MADLTAAIMAAVGRGDKNAELALEDMANRNLPEFIVALGTELASEAKDPVARQGAGLYLKNLLKAEDDTLQAAKHESWKNLDPAVRQNVKTSLLTALRSPEPTARHTAAQAASEVAAVELPFNAWPEFLSTLLENVASDQHAEGVKIASLECLGYTCERIAVLDNLPDIADTTTDAMLTTIVDGIQTSRPEPIRLAAAIALRNSLLFTQKNMEKKQERDAIMNNVCEATASPDVRVRAAAYECIVQIAFQYYDKLTDYMTLLFQLTTGSIKNDEDIVARQAIEFWSTLCEVEMELLDDAEESEARGLPIERPCVRYVAAAVEHLVPLLLESLTKQDENADVDDETYNVSMAAASCLSLISQTVEDLVVPVVMPFVQANIQSENWRLREAATMAFASILEGSTTEAIGPVVNQSIPVLMAALSDPHVLVRDTTAFAIGKICDFHIRAIPAETFPSLVNGLMSKIITESSGVSAQVCGAIHNLASAFATDETAVKTGSNALSPFIAPLLQNLLAVSDREDADEHNLRGTAMEAVTVLIQNSAPDVKPVLLELLPAILLRLQASHNIQALSSEEREKKEGLQGLLCSVVQVLTQKMSKEEFAPFADDSMRNLLSVLQTRNATCHSEAFSAVSAVADKMEKDFEKYMAHLQPFLIMGLKNFEAYQVCNTAVGLVGDISRAIEGRLQPYCDDIMSALVASLQDTSLHRSVKPPVLSCFGDIAMAIEAAYEPYVQFSLMLLLQASTTKAPDDDEDLIEYVNLLREAVLEAYTGIIQGLKAGNRIDLFYQYVQNVLQFLRELALDANRDDFVLSKAVGLIGDIACSLGPQVRDVIGQPFVAQLLREAIETDEDNNVETAHWAGTVIQELLQSN